MTVELAGLPAVSQHAKREMMGLTAAVLVVLGFVGPARALDLQVEATTASGANLPELTEAVARALVAGGARVVLQPAASAPCAYCARVAVVEGEEGSCRVEVTQERRRAAATLRLPPGSPPLDRARAIAIQARLLLTWDTSRVAKAAELAPRPRPRKAEGGAPAPLPVAAATKASPEALPPVAAPALVAEVERPDARAPDAARPGPAPAARPPVRADPTPPARAGTGSEPAADPGAAEATREPPRERARRASPAAARAVDGEREALAAALTVAPPTARKPLWPWIPTAIGAGAAVAAGFCGLVARDRYEGLADKTQSYASARALKSEGERWQLAGLVLAGVAVAGVTTGAIGFATRSPAVVAAPAPGGAVVSLAGGLP